MHQSKPTVCYTMQNYHLCSKTGSGSQYYREAIISIPKSQITNPAKNSDHTSNQTHSTKHHKNQASKITVF